MPSDGGILDLTVGSLDDGKLQGQFMVNLFVDTTLGGPVNDWIQISNDSLANKFKMEANSNSLTVDAAHLNVYPGHNPEDSPPTAKCHVVVNLN